jgi:RNA polymerase sigma-70 factor (ECF subfamily)
MSTSAARAKPNLRLVPPPSQAPAPRVPTPSLDDSELLAALHAGDPAAATALHDRVRPQVDRTIRRLLGRRDADHEDIAQQAMIELVFTIHRYRSDCSLDSWTSVVTAHVVYKYIRRRKTERRVFGDVDPDDLAPQSTTQTSRQAMARDAVRRVLAHMDSIEENKAWTFVLHDVCGYDLKEIAQITNVSVTAAQTRLVRGRREVHELIAADPELAGYLDGLEGHT